MIESLFLLIALANMVFAAFTTFYGPRWVLALTALSSLVAWLAIFLSAGLHPGYGLLAGLPWSTMLVGIGWFIRKYDESNGYR
jgi:hypothetical protein